MDIVRGGAGIGSCSSLGPMISSVISSDPLLECRKMVEQAKLECATRPIEAHPEFNKYISRDNCENILKNRLIAQRRQLLENYACAAGVNGTGVNCNSGYTKGYCGKIPKIEDFDIKNHPDFNKYIAKRDTLKIIEREVSRIRSEPITNHREYRTLKKEFQSQLKEKLKQYQRQSDDQPIEEHPNYHNLMKKYACVTDSCPPQYIPCQSCPTKPKCSGNGDISSDDKKKCNDDQYILKSKARLISKRLLEQVKQQYQNSQNSQKNDSYDDSKCLHDNLTEQCEPCSANLANNSSRGRGSVKSTTTTTTKTTPSPSTSTPTQTMVPLYAPTIMPSASMPTQTMVPLYAPTITPPVATPTQTMVPPYAPTIMPSAQTMSNVNAAQRAIKAMVNTQNVTVQDPRMRLPLGTYTYPNPVENQQGQNNWQLW